MQIKNKFQIAKALFNNTPSFGGNVLPTLLTPEKTVELFEFLLARKDIIIIDSEDVPLNERLMLIPGDYCTYLHTCPSKDRYVGVAEDDCKIDGNFPGRWGKDGSGYADNREMVAATKEYPWVEWKHEFLIRGVSRQVALDFEEFFIEFFDSYHHGLNLNEGGSGRPLGKRGKLPRVCPILVDWEDGRREIFPTQIAAARATGKSQPSISLYVNKKISKDRLGMKFTKLPYDFFS